MSKPANKHATTAGAILVALLVVFELSLGGAVAYLGLDWRSPLVTSSRDRVFTWLVIAAAVLSAVAVWQWLKPAPDRALLRIGAAGLGLLSLTGLAFAVSSEARFKSLRTKILEQGQDDRLMGIGGHLIVGYRAQGDIAKLVSNSVVAGVFVTARNVSGRTGPQIATEIAGWQKARAAAGLPPLFITTDQEGGLVSRLSPPLKRRASLAESIVKVPERDKKIAIAREYGHVQGSELAAIGVNVNFAPVVDLNFGVRGRNDAYTRIYQRAIARDPGLVTDLAGAFCDGLQAAGVLCTLKHFPGLGRVLGDTHVAEARLSAPVAELEATDLAPFRALGRDQNRMTMLSHVRLMAVDADTPVSLSSKVVTGMLRGDWKHTGVLVTDDITMRAAYASGKKRSLGSAAAATVRALNAGVDLVLISFDTDQVYPVLEALADAYGNRTLARDQLAASSARLAPLIARLSEPAATRFPPSRP